MIGPDILLSGLDASILAQIACLGAAVSYGFSGWFGRRFARLGVTPMQTAFGQVCASSLMMLPVMVIIDAPWRMPMPGLASLSAVLGLALLSTAFAYVIFFRLLASAGATNLGMVTLLVPVSALALSILFLDETLTLRQIVGMGLIAISLIAIDGRLYDRFTPPRADARQPAQRP
jgi:drug/metabolite transporter (DMT)-like permease